jgi:uncharacterized membrane protein
MLWRGLASIQLTRLITVVSQDLIHATARLFPDGLGYRTSEPPDWCKPRLSEGFERQARPVSAARSGYLQAIDGGGLMRLAKARDLVLRVTPPGRSVIRGSVPVMAAMVVGRLMGPTLPSCHLEILQTGVGISHALATNVCMQCEAAERATGGQ